LSLFRGKTFIVLAPPSFPNDLEQSGTDISTALSPEQISGCRWARCRWLDEVSAE
jgi:hypothetical protein